MKSILVDIGHPGHVHLFRVAILAWKAAGHKVIVTIRDRGIVSTLLDEYGIDYEVASKVRTGFFGLAFELFEHDWGVIRSAIRNRVDVMIGTSVCITHAGMFLNKPSIIFNEDDKHYLHVWAFIAYPIATRIVTPFALSDPKTSRYITHRSLHELAYLHPDHFTPDPAILDELGLKPDERFFIVRFVALQAHHDFKHRGLSFDQRKRLIALLEKHGRVFVSNEVVGEGSEEQYRLPIEKGRIHHAMYFADLLVGDSQTMAVEAAALGTTAIRCNTFVRQCSIINELDDRYGLIHSYHPSDFEKLLVDLENHLARREPLEVTEGRRRRLLDDKGNFAKFIETTVLDYKSMTPAKVSHWKTDLLGATDMDVALKVLEWIVSRDFQGIDPYLLDAKLNSVGSGSLLRPVMKKVRSALKPFHPFIPRRVFTSATPVLMPKVLGLSLSGIAGLSSQWEPNAYQSTIDLTVSKLLAARSEKSKHLSWGHPFSWGSAVRYEPDTPSIPVTGLVGHGLMDIVEAGRATGHKENLESIADYITTENGFKDFGSSICFYYAPSNLDLTYNTSILAASYLVRLDGHFNSNAYSDLAARAVRFVIEGQNPDGSWYYTDPRGDTPLDKTIDGRHSGFILEHLARILPHLHPDDQLAAQVREALAKGTEYYLTRMMDGAIPRWDPESTYPVDVKDVAQATITLSVLGRLDQARETLDFAYKHFFDGTGAFWYKLHKGGSVNKTVFIRWSQAWMLKAIGTLIAAESKP